MMINETIRNSQGIELMLLFLVLLLPTDRIVCDTTDEVEVNHVYSEDGEHRFSQLIWWDWNTDVNRFDIVDWRFVKDADMPRRVGRSYTVEWTDKRHCHRRVVSKAYRTTYTIDDPELQARELLLEHCRRKLRN